MDSDGDAAIRGVRLTKTFQSGGNELIVFSDMDFEVQRGERLALELRDDKIDVIENPMLTEFHIDFVQFETVGQRHR